MKKKAAPCFAIAVLASAFLTSCVNVPDIYRGVTGLFSYIYEESGAKKESEKGEIPESGITGTLAVSTKRERIAADRAIQTVFLALENKDTDAIKKALSPYAKSTAEKLDESIRALMEYYPGANGGYQGVCVSKHDNHYGTIQDVLVIHLIVTNNSMEYDLNICLFLRDDHDNSKEGIHSVQMIRDEDKTKEYLWKEDEDAPGIYAGT